MRASPLTTALPAAPARRRPGARGPAARRGAARLRVARLLGALLLLASLLASAGCGRPQPEGEGWLLPGAQGAPDHLVLLGTPREQGAWQAWLLGPRVAAFHEAWQRALLAADGDLLSPATRARRADLLRLLEPARAGLPERVRDELASLSIGSGLPEPTLLLSELLTDLLRYATTPAPVVEGRLARTAPGEAWLSLTGPLAEVLRPHLVWITRRATAGEPGVTVLAWPGSLGALAAVRPDGLALLAHEVPLEAGRQVLKGVPFDLSLRLALERAPGRGEQAVRARLPGPLAGPGAAQALLAALTPSTAHRVLALDLAGATGREALLALVGEDAADAPLAPSPPPRPAHGVRWQDGTVHTLYAAPGASPPLSTPLPGPAAP